jgi:hypothetical protein
MSPNAGGGGGVAGSQPMSTAVHRSPNKLFRSNSTFNLPVPLPLLDEHLPQLITDQLLNRLHTSCKLVLEFLNIPWGLGTGFW